MSLIYLDYNATTPVDPGVREAMLPYLADRHGNPSSDHVHGRLAREAVQAARDQVAALLGAGPEEIVFTSGGTEANNQALKGVFLAGGSFSLGAGHLVISALEHPAIVAPARFLERLGAAVSVVPCTAAGVVEPDAVLAAVRPDTKLVSIMLANNEIGTLQPLAEIARRCRERDVLVHTDAAQAVGKIPVRVEELGIDLVSIAGHKMYAPKGVGALYVRKGVPLEPLLHGAAHEGGRRAGTENVPYLVGLGAAAEIARRGLAQTGPRLAALRDRLLAGLRAAIARPLVVPGEAAPRLPNTLSVAFPGVSGAELLHRVPELCASTGSACHSGTTRLSATLAAIGLSADLGRGVVRLSLGWSTSEAEVDRAVSLLAAAWESLCAAAAAGGHA